MNKKDFYESLTDSEGSFRAAIANEERHGFEFEDTMERKYEEGFIDGMRHAYALLTGDAPEGRSSDELESYVRSIVRCEHDKFSTSVRPCEKHGEEADCHQRTCDNCNGVMRHIEVIG